MKKTQEEIKRYVDKKRKETEDWRKRDKVMLSTKDLVFKERLMRKLVEKYVGLSRSLTVDFIYFYFLSFI